VLIVVGNAEESDTAMGRSVTTAAVADAVLDGSVLDVATMVMVPPTGTFELFVKLAGLPLAVCEVMAPQFVVLQRNVQSTPAFAVSFVTTALTVALLPWPVCCT
jgi:hypothetical protein